MWSWIRRSLSGWRIGTVGTGTRHKMVLMLCAEKVAQCKTSHSTYPSFWPLLLRLQFGHQRYHRHQLCRVCLVHFELYQQTNIIRRHFKKTIQCDAEPILSISLYPLNLAPLERLLDPRTRTKTRTSTRFDCLFLAIIL